MENIEKWIRSNLIWLIAVPLLIGIALLLIEYEFFVPQNDSSVIQPNSKLPTSLKSEPNISSKVDSKSEGCIVFVLFDLPADTNEANRSRHHINEFKKVVNTMRNNDLLVGDFISDNSLATASYPIYNRFSESGTGPYGQVVFRQKIIQKVERILNNTFSSMTDLMNSFQLAEKAFDNEKNKSQNCKILVVFSTMMEISQRYNFEKERLTKMRIQEIIQSEKTKGALPNLDGVKIWVVGGYTSIQGRSDPERLLLIQDFWLKYFKECGGDLDETRYGNTLLNFSL